MPASLEGADWVHEITLSLGTSSPDPLLLQTLVKQKP